MTHETQADVPCLAVMGPSAKPPSATCAASLPKVARFNIHRINGGKFKNAFKPKPGMPQVPLNVNEMDTQVDFWEEVSW